MEKLHRELLDKLLRTCPDARAIARLIVVWVGYPVALWGSPLPELQTNPAIEHYRIQSPETREEWRYVHSCRPIAGTKQHRTTGLMTRAGRQLCRLYGTLQFDQAIVGQLAVPIAGTTAYATVLWSDRSELTVRIGSDLGFRCMVQQAHAGVNMNVLRAATPLELMRLYLAKALPQQLFQVVS